MTNTKKNEIATIKTGLAEVRAQRTKARAEWKKTSSTLFAKARAESTSYSELVEKLPEDTDRRKLIEREHKLAHQLAWLEIGEKIFDDPSSVTVIELTEYLGVKPQDTLIILERAGIHTIQDWYDEPKRPHTERRKYSTSGIDSRIWKYLAEVGISTVTVTTTYVTSLAARRKRKKIS